LMREKLPVAVPLTLRNITALLLDPAHYGFFATSFPFSHT
jgi:hypothetical protein